MYFFGFQLDGPITGGGGLITGILRYTAEVSSRTACSVCPLDAL